MSAQPPRTYPLPLAPGDERFDTTLLLDVGDTLTRHGYPEPQLGDLPMLAATLRTFVYGSPG